MYLGRLLDNRLRMGDVRLGIGDSMLLLSTRLVLGGDLLAQFALARCGGGFAVCSSSRAASASVVTA